MGTILASAILADASEILQDPSNIRWTVPKLLSWLNAGQREIVLLRPNANAVNAVIELVAGTKQSLPADGVLFLDVLRNMGVDGATPGRVPRFIARADIDAENPDWHLDTASAKVQHFIYDDRDQTHFYVYPKQPATEQGHLEILYSATPADIATQNDPITLNDIYANALMNYVVYRALEKDPINAVKVGEYYQGFMLLVTGKSRADDNYKPQEGSEK